ncbi:hypothetical protein CAOG_006851 [Capsaspora owczarzaki ATCC 30864]|uniref:BHLH domain-containing protein n=2 Tax=Capsaspora owczarzaki (strain ATCC 30864) TaxID=595528 RepID=A0A0D2WV02_CAPO3|nr:hypothetical protein CAOG_006851 [Capsaspora owczarzaki ATCC 30864]
MVLPRGAVPLAALPSKSNYQTMIEGKGHELGMDEEAVASVTARKNTHKVGEKKRRDDLKDGFDDLKSVLGMTPETSKAAVIRRAVEHAQYHEKQIREMRSEIAKLRAQLAAQGTNSGLNAGSPHDSTHFRGDTTAPPQ